MITDEQLMNNIKDGNIGTLAVLFEQYHVRLYNYFLRLTANVGTSEDLVQEVFLRILKYRATYQSSHKFLIWMYRIARNVHIDHLKKHNNEIALNDENYEIKDSEVATDDKYVHAEDIEIVTKALHRLPLKKREVLMLSRFQNMKCQEIADLYGCTVSSVKVLLHRSIKELKNKFLELKGGINS